MSTQIIVKALKRELEVQAEAIRSALWRVRRIGEDHQKPARQGLDEAMAILRNAAAGYDAVAMELELAEAAHVSAFNAKNNA